MRRLFSNTTFDFIGVRRYAYIITAVIFLPGLLLLAVRGLNYSIEFTGGTLIQVSSRVPVDVGRLRGALDQSGVPGAEIQSFGGEGGYLVRARLHAEAKDADNTDATVTAVRQGLDQALGAGNYTVVRKEAVGPKVGGELRQRALLAIMVAFGAILIYLATRFEWRFGLASILATAHDVLGTVIFVSFLRLEVSLVVVGAVLSVLGLSLNETIIIFDRVRENERHRRYPDLKATLNRSINETLPRTVLTHGTTLATMLTLTIFGGEVIRPFALVMFFGVFTGVFSSMFIAPAVLMYIRHRWPLTGGAAPRASRTTPGRKPQPVG